MEQRAIAIFGRNRGWNGEANWPYGLEHPSRNLKRTHPEIWARVSVEQPRAQKVIVEWAERYGLKASDAGCCPRWLQRKTSRRCEPDSCTRYGNSNEAPDHDWLDHATAWLLGGKPAAMTSAPYGDVSDSDRLRFAYWQAEDSRLRVRVGGEGWYGHSTTQILMWRSDRISSMETAPDAQISEYPKSP